MNLLILDGAPYRHAPAAAARRLLAEEAVGRGWTPRTFFLPDLRIADCVADFKCWTRTPGVCAIDDASRDVSRAFVESELVVFLTPVTFGGYASELKKALDHLLANILPFFERVDGETHHPRRYERMPAFLALGLLPSPDAGAERVFHALAARNALNVRGPCHASAIIHATDSIEASGAAVRQALDHLAAGGGGTRRLAIGFDGEDAPEAGVPLQPPESPIAAPRRALLVVGSPGGGASTSASLGGALLSGLGARGVACETSLLYKVQRTASGLDALVASCEQADLLIFASPLYVDSLPAPVIRLLERLATIRRTREATAPRSLVAIVNSGFPEVRHNHTALAIYRTFAREAGWRWAGGLPLGAGGMIGGRPLASLGGRARHLVRALDLTAAALAGGQGVPDDAVALFSRKAVPFWLYRFMAGLGYRLAARKQGTSTRLRDRPYGQGLGPRDSGVESSSR